MDTFVEQIVAKKKSGTDLAVIAGIVLLLLILLLFVVPLLFAYIGFLAPLLLIAAGYGAWWLITSRNLEYEYSVTNGDIDIDQIIARRKRKRVVSVAGPKIESLLPYRPEALTGRKFDRQLIAAPSANEPDLWCFTYHSKKNGHTLVIFQPEDRVLEALKVGLSALVLRETNKAVAE